jgi:hypothetical protein
LSVGYTAAELATMVEVIQKELEKRPAGEKK